MRFPEVLAPIRFIEPSTIALRCPRCGETAVPMPFFVRGTNVIKLFILFAITSFFGPVLYFFLRKDRLICRHCQTLFSQQRPMGLLEAFSDDPRGWLPGGVDRSANQDPLTTSTVEDEQLTKVLDKKVLKAKTLAWSMGLTGSLFIIADLVHGGPGGGVGFGVFCGALALYFGIRAQKHGRKAGFLKHRLRTLRVIHLARQHQGRINVTLVSAALGLDFKEAEALLDSMVDGQRVDMDVDGEGRVTYVFPELLSSRR
jgi:hypothetical protein